MLLILRFATAATLAFEGLGLRKQSKPFRFYLCDRMLKLALGFVLCTCRSMSP